MSKQVSPAPVRTVGRPNFALPSGSCDCHVHVIGPQQIYPVSPSSPFAVEDSTLDDLRRVQAGLGFSRAVLVASALYGYNYQPLLHALCRDPSRYRGVAILAPDITDSELEILDGAGVVGARFFPGLTDPNERTLSRVRELGWSAHFALASPEQTEHWRPWIDACAGRFVIEHSGMPDPDAGPDSAHLRRLFGYLESGRCWIKLAHRFTRQERPPFTDIVAINRAIIAQRPDRILYGSDYPHLNYFNEMPREEDLINMMASWVSRELDLHRILIDNPEELFGFTRDLRSAEVEFAL